MVCTSDFFSNFLHALVSSGCDGSPAADQVRNQHDHDKSGERNSDSDGDDILDFLVRFTVVVWNSWVLTSDFLLTC